MPERKIYKCDICKEKMYMQFSAAGKGSYCFICYDKYIIDKKPLPKEKRRKHERH